MSNRLFGWDYPPGVTGLEPAIAGYPPCTRCGHDYEEHSEDGIPLSECCGAPAIDDMEFCAKCRNASGFWPCYPDCTCKEYTDRPPEHDPDERGDRERYRRAFGD